MRDVLRRAVVPCVLAGLGYLAYGFYLAPPKASQDWAAWAQAYGATVALAIAIYVPYRQREDAKREHQAREAEQAALHSQISILIVSDVIAFLERTLAYPYARKFTREPLVISDFLERIRLAEFSDTDFSHALLFFPVRNAVLLVQQSLSDDGRSEVPLQEEERDEITKRKSDLESIQKAWESNYMPLMKRYWDLNPEKAGIRLTPKK